MGNPGSGVSPDWYATAFDARTAGLMWAELTGAEVDLVLRALEPPPGARILDLGCGGGRHAVELARRGFEVLGVDISSELIEIAEGEAELKGVDARFLRADLRELACEEEFDVVLNLHDGAIGYFEDDAENRRAFEVIARALRPGGANLIQVPNVLYAEERLPQRSWLASEQAIELLDRSWNARDRRLEGEMIPIVLGDWYTGMTPIGCSQRLYSIAELRELYASVGMVLTGVLDADGEPRNPAAPEEEEIFAVARKLA